MENPLYVSGVKGNIGHLEAAAGIGGILSAILALQHQEAPPNAQLRELNAKVAASVKGTPIVFPRESSALHRHGDRRLLAGVSSFGYSGTIAHVVLEEAPEGHRRATDVLAAASEIPESSSSGPVVQSGLVWQFAGQGTLSVGVLKELFDTESSYREALASCDDILRMYLGVGATDLLYPGASVGSKREGLFSEERAKDMLSETRYSQPILVSLEYSLCQVWLSRGVKPSAVMGHSLGEYAACVVAGVMSLEDCLRVVCERGRLMQENEACIGRMVAVRCSMTEVTSAIEEVGAAAVVSVAAVNGPRSVVVSGSTDGVERVLQCNVLASCGKHPLQVSRAFHSPLMAAVLDDFREVLSSVQYHRPAIRVISTVTGGYVDEALTDFSYWIDHMMQPVLYQAGVECMMAHECAPGVDCSIVEMGADSTLTRLAEKLYKRSRSIRSEGGVCEEKVIVNCVCGRDMSQTLS